MKIKILGSGGGEGFPATFCACDHCEEARRVGGKSLRSLSQTLINSDLLIDFPADSGMHALVHNVNFGSISNVLITHAHHDHFIPVVFCERGAPYAHNLVSTSVDIYGSGKTSDRYNDIMGYYMRKGAFGGTVRMNTVAPFETFTAGRYTVTALPAKHAPGLDPLNYIVECEGKTLIYFLDTGFPTDELLDFVGEKVAHADCVIMDATFGYHPLEDTAHHMSFDHNKRLKKRLIDRGIADGTTVFVADHITHNKAETHDKIEQIFDGSGILVAYDGMELEI